MPVDPTRRLLTIATLCAAGLAGGGLKALAVTGARPSPLLTNVPTFTQLGYKSFEPYGWFALLTQAATRPAIAQKLSDEMITIVAQPEVRKRLLELGLQPGGDAQADGAREMRADLTVWGKVIQDANIRID